ncbi:hypothetical protein F4778DRAFT_773940 [Xylariomycetidae sp. FL2044]|nr:hypothetical protein F4778DRAFT_773940 [Xylariomycetidae sp. FL2044]
MSGGRQTRRSGPRKKTGCYTCKSRHTHCDERKPVCRNCERLNLACRQFEFIIPSSWCPPSTPVLENPPTETSSGSTSHGESPMDSTPSTSSALSPPSTSSSALLSPLPQYTARPSPLPLNGEVAHLLSVYATSLATWMDIFDHTRSYQFEVPRRCLTSELLTKCVCAFTAKHLSQLPSGEVWSARAVHYYGDALRLLIQHLDGSPGDALTANMLLSSYEMLDARAHEHQRHLNGASALIRIQGIDARSRGMDAANFWIYVRHEITVALDNGATLHFVPDDWNVDFRPGKMDEDALANQLMWLVARAIHLICGSEGSPNLERGLETIHKEAVEWFDNLPISFQPVHYGEVSDMGFNKVYLSVPAAAGAIMWYHLLFILLGAETTSQYPSRIYQIQDHAIGISNLAVSEIPDSVRGFSVQPLFFAAKHISGIGKKTKLWGLLDDLEIRFGLRTRSRVQKLQQLAEPTV